MKYVATAIVFSLLLAFITVKLAGAKTIKVTYKIKSNHSKSLVRTATATSNPPKAKMTTTPSQRLPVVEKKVPSNSVVDEIVQATTETFGADQADAMVELVRRESTWNPYAINPSSGACGLFQSLPCSKVLSVSGTLDNVQGQIQWGVRYIQERYQNPSNALLFHDQHNWY